MTHHPFQALSLCVALLLSPAATHATAPPSPDPISTTARLIGPGVYGSTFSVAFHPSDPATYVTGTDVSGFFITRNDGKSWSVITGENIGLAGPGSRGAWSALFDPHTPETLWLGGQIGLFKSTNGGKSAALVLPSMIGAIAVDPSLPGVVYAGNSAMKRLGRLKWSPGLIYKSTDNGKSWQPISPGGRSPEESQGRNWTRIVIDSASPVLPGKGHSRLYAIDLDELWRSDDAGATWHSLLRYTPGAGEQARLITDLVAVPSGGEMDTLYATLRVHRSRENGELIGGPYRSLDGGRTWEALGDNLRRDYLPHWFATGWPHSTLGWSPAMPDRLYLSNATNVYRSDDAGKTWHPTMQPQLQSDWLIGWGNDRLSPLWKTGDKVKHAYPNDALRLWKEGSNFRRPFYGFVWAGNDISVSPVSADHVLCAGSASRITRDGGKWWDEPMFEYGEAHHPPAFPNALPGLYTHRVRSTGPQVVVANRIAFHPEKPETFAVAYMDYGLFLTRDGGKWWEWAWKGMVSPFSRLLARQVAYDPDQPERVYVVGGKYDGGVAYIHRSDDGGRTFTPYPVEPLRKALEAFKGKQSQAVGITDLLPDPASPVEKRRFYLATTIGLFHGSLEGPWEKISEGLPESVFGLRVASDGSQQLMLDPANPKRLYFYGRGAQRRAATSDAGLYCYEDGEWKRLGPEQIGAVSSFSLSQQQPDLLYVVAAEAGVGPGGTSTPTRLLISRDRGATWSQGDAPPGLITGAYLHPSHPERVYLLTHTLKDPVQEPTMIYRRDAAGEPWHPMSAPGMAFSMTPFGPCSIAFPPHDPQRFYLIPNSGIYEITETGRTDR